MFKISLRLRIFLSLFATFGVLLHSQGGWAQSTTASLQVTISDSSGAVVPDTDVSVVDLGTGVTHKAVADSTGVVIFPRLAVGKYQLTATKDGFSKYSQSGVTLTVGQAASINVKLEVGAISSTVQVTSAIPLVNTRNATSTALVGERQVVGLPLNGREAQSLVLTLPGTTDEATNGCFICAQGGVYPGSPTYSINGTQRSMINYQLDGVDNNDTYIDSSLPFPNPDAIKEFVLQSANFSAEFGNAAGGIVNIVSKSGTNEFHGDAFEFLRNGSLNAKNFFGTNHDSLHRNQFGGVLGGPILKNRLFFFTSYQGTRTSSASTAGSSFTPTAAERTGDFSALLPQTQLKDPMTGLPVAGNIIPSNRLDPVAQALLKDVPLPNGSNDHVTFTTAAIRTQDDQVLGKIDFNAGKNQFSGHYFYTRYSQPAVVPTGNLLAANNQGSLIRVQTVSADYTYVQSPTLLFNTTFGLYRQAGGSLSSAPYSLAKLGANIATPSVPELLITITNGGFSLNTGHEGEFDRDGFTIREDVTKIIGRHELHFGGEALRVSNNLINQFLQNGYFVFRGQLSGNSLADFLYGSASTFEQGGGQYENVAGTQWALFAQDNWRATDRLTINAGLRWDPWFPLYDRQNRVNCFVPGQQSTRFPNAPAGFLYGGTDHDKGCPKAGSNPYLPEFGPRIGFAYRVTQDGRTSIRGGFGVYYSPFDTSNYHAASAAPFSPQFTYSDVQLSDPYGSLGIPNPFPAQYGPKLPASSAPFTLPVSLGGAFDKNWRLPVINSWNLILEHQVGNSSVARLTYVGNEGNHMTMDTPRELNPAIYIPGGSTVANTQARRPYQDFTNIQQFQSNGISNYNGLQVSYETRMSSGLTLLGNYTWSKCLDNIFGYGAQWTDPYSRAIDYGPCLGNATNNFKLSQVWDIPVPQVHSAAIEHLIRGWEISSIIGWHSGFGYTPVSGVDNSFSGVNLDHADYLGGPIQMKGGRSQAEEIKQWFNTSQFVPNAIGTFGDASKGQITGPRYFNADMALVKNIRIKDGVHMILRGEAFNAFNNVNFGAPQLSQKATQFGQITSAFDPRIIQLATKIVF